MTHYQTAIDNWNRIKQQGPLNSVQQAQCLSDLQEARGWDTHGGQVGYQAHLAQLAQQAAQARQREIASLSGLSPYSTMVAGFQYGYNQANQ